MTKEEAISKVKGYLADLLPSEEYDEVEEIIEALEQEPKTGYWIVEVWNNKEHHTCSSCQHVVDYEPCYHYCPYCGAKMVESQESEDKR